MSPLTGQAIVDALRSATETLVARATAAHGVTLTDLQAVADAAQVGEYCVLGRVDARRAPVCGFAVTDQSIGEPMYLLPEAQMQRGTTPTWYVCEVCGAAGVALYRKAASSHVEMHCAQCVREVSRKTKDPATYHKNFVPAVPARGHADSRKDAAFYGLTSIPNLGCLWWESLPNEGVAP